MDLDVEPIKGVASGLTDQTDKDVNKKVKILGWVVKKIKGVCEKLEGMGEA